MRETAPTPDASGDTAPAHPLGAAWALYALLFLTSGAVMAIELVAARLAAPYIGMSLYTWTGIIGAVLAGMSLGHMAGGHWADRVDPRKLLATLLLTAGVLSVNVLILVGPVLSNMPRSWDPLATIFLGSLALFGVPCFILAATTPAIYKLALRSLEQAGLTVGRLGAAGVLGALVGTYATGFWLIPSLGTRTIIFAIALLLVALGLAVVPWRRRGLGLAGAVLVLLLPIVLPAQALPVDLDGPCTVESEYYCIEVHTETQDPLEGPVRTMVLDDLIHSGIRLEAPGELWYPYERTVAELLEAWGGENVSSLFLGGGGYIMPHWMTRHHPAGDVTVIEIDPAVTEVALTDFVPDAQGITTWNRDARLALADVAPGHRYEVVFGDVFHGITVPWHLTTVEFAAMVRDHLAASGLYVVNTVDVPDGAFLSATVATLGEVFPHVEVLPGSDVTLEQPVGTYIVVASLDPVDLPGTPLTVPPGMVLTDDHAPVDRLLRPAVQAHWASQGGA